MNSQTATPTANLQAEDLYRLPTALKPTHYKLDLKTDLDSLTFLGAVTISLDVLEETSKIILNASDMKLERSHVTTNKPGGPQRQAKIISTAFDEVHQRVTYTLEDPLTIGTSIRLIIRFSARISDTRRGYFRAAWSQDGAVKYYALTQFEAIAARNAFPCWDEPAFKARFTLTMVSSPETINIGNMPARSDVVIGVGHDVDFTPSSELGETLSDLQLSTGVWRITSFETTPLMSTYVVAFGNGPFKFLERSIVMPLSGKTVPLRTYATPDIIGQTQYVLDATAAVLPIYEQTFGIEYPLPKLDSLISHDFEGAMENWGLIIGSSQFMLIDPDQATQAAKMDAFYTQSHEIAHMWFGNITTMKWWDNLYLNEGFATLMGGFIVPDRVLPEWNAKSSFITTDLKRAMTLDAKVSSHPIEVDCPDVNRINEIFDALSYSKAASVLRMLSHHVGEDKFLEGVSLYLKAHLFSNTVTSDLWEGISSATGLDVAQLMENWISKIGYPVLTVTENETGITVRQDRFLETGPPDPKDNETIWNVPLSLVSVKESKASMDKDIVLRTRDMSIILDTTQPFKLNSGTTGIYRVLYTPERLEKIAAEAAKENSIFTLDDKTGLLLDAFSLSKGGFSKVSSALTLVSLWKGETEYLVWEGISASLEELVSIWWENEEAVNKLKELERVLFSPLVKKLGYKYHKDDSKDTVLLRTLVIERSAYAGDKDVLAELNARFKKYLDTGNDSEIVPELKSITYAMAVKYGGRVEYDTIVRILEQRRNPVEENAAIIAMAAAGDPDLIRETAGYISKARDQDVIPLFKALSNNFAARRIATQYMMDNYDPLFQRFKNQFTLGALFSASTNYYSSQADYKSIETYFKGKDTSKYSAALAQTLDAISSRSAYVERSTSDLLDWFNNNHRGSQRGTGFGLVYDYLRNFFP